MSRELLGATNPATVRAVLLWVSGERGCSLGPSPRARTPRSGDIQCSRVQHPGLSLQLGGLRTSLSTPMLGWAGSELQGRCSPAVTGSPQ